LTETPWYILYNKGDRKTAEKENISKCKKASKTVVEEEDKASMYLQRQQTSCAAAQPRLALAGDALC
jgi:hypothetical protein